MATQYVSVEGWSPRADEYPVAALPSLLYPPLVSCVRGSGAFASSPRMLETSPSAAASSRSFFLTSTAETRNPRGAVAVRQPSKPLIPSSYEQQQQRCRWWHHEFHLLLEKEVKAVHKRQTERHVERMNRASATSAVPNLAPSVSLSGELPPAKSPPDDATSGSDIHFLGEGTAQAELLGTLLSNRPPPLALYGSSLPNAPRSYTAVPGLMTTAMAAFLGEFETACIEGAHHVLDTLVRENASELPRSTSPSPINSGMSSPRVDRLTSHGNPNLVKQLEGNDGRDTPNFFVYKHMIFNVLHLVQPAVMRVFGCLENVEKMAAAEMRGLHYVVQVATLKGSLTLTQQAQQSKQQHKQEQHEEQSSNLASLSVPLVCFLRIRGVSMFVVAQPSATSSESVVAGPGLDGIHIPSATRHTSVIQALCADLRVPGSTFFVNDMHKRLMSQCPALGHPELTVTLANKLATEYEEAQSGMVGQLQSYQMPFLPPSRLRKVVASRRPFETASATQEDDEGDAGPNSSDVPAQYVRDVLILQNVARLVTPPVDFSQSLLMPHIVNPSAHKEMRSPNTESVVHSPLQRLALPFWHDKNQTAEDSSNGRAVILYRDRSASNGPPLGNRFLEIGRGAHLWALLHPSFVMTLPYNRELPRSSFNCGAPPNPGTTARQEAEVTTDFSATCKAVTHQLLVDQVDKMIEWILALLDTVPSVGQFIDVFDGTLLKALLHVWGINLRYLGVVHRRLCDAIPQKIATALSATVTSLQAACAAKDALAGSSQKSTFDKFGGVATAAIIGSQKVKRKKEAAAAAVMSAHLAGAPQGAQSGAGVGGATGTQASLAALSSSTLNSSAGKLPAGRLFLSRGTSLDAPLSSDVAWAVRDAVVAVSSLLGAELESDALVTSSSSNPHPPLSNNNNNKEVSKDGPPIMGGRRSSVLAGSLAPSVGTAPAAMEKSTLSTRSKLFQRDAAGRSFGVAGGITSSGSSTGSATDATECVRDVHRRSVLEHFLLVLRAEMIARCARNVIVEHMRAVTLGSRSSSSSDSPRMLPALPRKISKVDIAVKAITFGKTLQQLTSGDLLLTPPNGSTLDAAAASSAAYKQLSTSAKLFQKLKDLNAVLDEKRVLSHSPRELVTTRNVDRIVTLDVVQNHTVAHGAPREANTASVLQDDPTPQYLMEGLFNSEMPDAEKVKVAEILNLLVCNGSTTASAAFWQQAMMSELWTKYANFTSSTTAGSGAAGNTGNSAAARRSTIQKTDMLVVMHRVAQLVGIEFSSQHHSAIAAQYSNICSPSMLSTATHAPDDSMARSSLRSLQCLAISHRSIEKLYPTLRTTLGCIPSGAESAGHVTLAKVQHQQRSSAAAATGAIRERTGMLPLALPTTQLFDAKREELERELFALQHHRFLAASKKFKEGLGDDATQREIFVLDALVHLYRHGGRPTLPHLQLAEAQLRNGYLVMFYHKVAKLWKRVGFDGICYRPCGSCGVLFNNSVSDVHRCGDVSTKVDKEQLAVGVADGKLPSELITASSWTEGFEPCFARACVPSSCWRPAPNGHSPYIEFTFGTTREICMIEMRGDGDKRFVDSFQLEYTLDFKNPEIFTGVYYHKDENRNAPVTGNYGTRGEELVAVPALVASSGSKQQPFQRQGTAATLFADSSIAFVASVRFDLHAEPSFASPVRGIGGGGGGGVVSRDGSSGPNSARPFDSTLSSLGATVKNPAGTTRNADGGPHAVASARGDTRAPIAPTRPPGVRTTFLKGNTDAVSLVRIEFAVPFRCSKLRLTVGNENVATAGLHVELYYTSRHMPSPGRGGAETIAVNHVTWDSTVTLSNLGGQRTSLTSQMTRRQLAEKEFSLLERIATIEKDITDTSSATRQTALPHELVLIRASTELPQLWNQELHLLISWGMERASDVQVAQFRLAAYFLAEIKFYARHKHLDVAASKVDRFVKQLDDIVGPLGFGGVATLVCPLLDLMRDAFEAANVLNRHIGDFLKMVEWASDVRHPLLGNIVATLVDAVGCGTAEEKDRVAEVCSRLAEEGRLDDLLLIASSTSNTSATPPSEGKSRRQHQTEARQRASSPYLNSTFSPSARAVFERLRLKQQFLRAKGEGENCLYPEESEFVHEREQAQRLL